MSPSHSSILMISETLRLGTSLRSLIASSRMSGGIALPDSVDRDLGIRPVNPFSRYSDTYRLMVL